MDVKTLQPAELSAAVRKLRLDPDAPPELWHALAAVVARLHALEDAAPPRP
jgi:type III secretion system FlhB-like substrate exporter